MNATRITPILFGLLLIGATGAERFDDFRVIAQRNIFNLNRAPRRSESTTVRPPPRPVSSDAFTLVGTMAYETNQIAFFDGSSADYRRAVRPDEMIAGYKLVTVRVNSVCLELDGQPVEMRIGARLPRAGGSHAPLSTNVETQVSSPPTTDIAVPPPAADVAGATTAPAADPSDILKKLMQRRQQELQ